MYKTSDDKAYATLIGNNATKRADRFRLVLFS